MCNTMNSFNLTMTDRAFITTLADRVRRTIVRVWALATWPPPLRRSIGDLHIAISLASRLADCEKSHDKLTLYIELYKIGRFNASLTAANMGSNRICLRLDDKDFGLETTSDAGFLLSRMPKCTAILLERPH